MVYELAKVKHWLELTKLEILIQLHLFEPP